MTALYVYVAGQHTKEYGPGKREGSDDDIVLPGPYSLVWTMLYVVHLWSRRLNWCINWSGYKFMC